jgi:hypothetical protein
VPRNRLILFVGGELDGQLHHQDMLLDAGTVGEYRATGHVADRAEGRAQVFEHRASDRGYHPR